MYRDRTEAGRRLADDLHRFAHERPIILGLPRGGVVVAAQVARVLGADLDIIVVRKLGAPTQHELAVGAVSDAEHPRVMLDDALIKRLNIGADYLEREIAEQTTELRRRESTYRGGAAPLPVRGRAAIVVDDGVATGASTRAALRAIRAREPSLLVLAVPVGAPESLRALRGECDEVVCPLAPEPFHAVGAFYERFEQTSDAEVMDLLDQARRRNGPSAPHAAPQTGSAR